MIGYLKVLLPLGALAFVAFRYQLLKFPLQPPATAAPAATALPVTRKIDVAVETVRAGSLPGFTSKSVGETFERRFQNPQWSSFHTPNGVTIVDFHGTILADALNVADLNASHANPIVLRSNCVRSLGLAGAMADEATSSRVAEQTYRSNLDEIQERKGSQTASKEYVSAVSARKQQEAAEKKLDADHEAKIRACIANSPIAVHFQFTLSADQKTFELGYIDKEPFGEAAPNAVLAFVYH